MWLIVFFRYMILVLLRFCFFFLGGLIVYLYVIYIEHIYVSVYVYVCGVCVYVCVCASASHCSIFNWAQTEAASFSLVTQ